MNKALKVWLPGRSRGYRSADLRSAFEFGHFEQERQAKKTHAEGVQRTSPGPRPGKWYVMNPCALKGPERAQVFFFSYVAIVQEQHHQVRTFQDEFRAFLRRYEITYDEKYLWI
jgi:hypothetical protein